MTISATEVAKLRKMTGAGMMDCKKALEEANGNFERASEIIREKGKLIAAKRADREANEGVVLSKTNKDKKAGAIITLNCETDFVAKNVDFIALAQSILDVAINEKPKTLDELKALKINGTPINDLIVEQIGVIGEKLDLSYYQFIEGTYVLAYIHQGNKTSSLVAFDTVIEERLAKDIAMQIAAMAPVAIDQKDVPQEVIDKELAIAAEKARLEGKPENLLEKIAQGRLQKFFQESTLLNQEFVLEGKITVREYLEKNAKGTKVTAFKRYSLND